MKLSFSNIGFENGDEERAYALLKQNGFCGLEIAPSKFVGENPYDKLSQAVEKSRILEMSYGFEISSMQSIWFGMTGNIFNSEESEALKEYTQKAVLFAQTVGCKSLVFGCPKNRNIPLGLAAQDAGGFFEQIADFAAAHGTAIALEANVAAYGTNFINTSQQAFEYARAIDNLKVNYDFGTFIANSETLDILEKNLDLVSHIHISEPNLAAIEKHEQHKNLASLLRSNGYGKFVSVEMKAQPVEILQNIIQYIAEVFN